MKKFIFPSILISILLLITGCQTGTTTATVESISSSLIPVTTEYDFGTISMEDGNVTTTFEVKNEGEEPITITRMYTSCMCTTSQLHTDAGSSDILGMPGHGGASSEINMIIEPGETSEVETIFDPNAHGPQGVGTIRRTVILETNSSTTPEVKLDFSAEVVKSIN